MTAPYMPLFVADYLADTAHLSAVEHGAYLLLIMNYWQRGKALPADDRKLARIARLNDADWSEIRDTVGEFFTEEEGEWRHARIEAEIKVAGEKSAKAKAAARASVEARKATAERSLSDRSTDGELLGEDRLGKETPLPEPKSSTTNVRSIGKPIRPATSADFEEFWKAYPSRGHASNPKAPAQDKFARAVKGGADPAAIIAGARRYAEIERNAGRDGTEKIAQAITWLNQRRWGDYAPSDDPASPSSPSLCFVRVGTAEWDAWQAHKGKKLPFKHYPEHDGEGWLLPSRWPPQTTQGAA